MVFMFYSRFLAAILIALDLWLLFESWRGYQASLAESVMFNYTTPSPVAAIYFAFQFLLAAALLTAFIAQMMKSAPHTKIAEDVADVF